MNNIEEVLETLATVEGFLGVALVDSESGIALGVKGGHSAPNLELAASGNSAVIRAKRRVMKALELKDEIEDILITLGKQVHLMRLVRNPAGLFFYLAVDRSRANLAIARLRLVEAEKALIV